MPSPLDRVGAALLPREGLAVLAGQRCQPEVMVSIDGLRAWVTWPPGLEAVWRALLSASGVLFFEQIDGSWHSLGRRLPRFDLPPSSESRKLDSVMFPAVVRSLPPTEEPGRVARLRLVASHQPRPTSALRTTLTELRHWAESAPGAEIRTCRAATGGDRVILMGSRVPVLPSAERFWGRRVLSPLGFRPDPDLPEAALRTAAGVGLADLLWLTESGVEAIPDSAFAPLTRGALRRRLG